MTHQSAHDLLQAVRRGGYALGAFNAVNLETAQAIVWAAEREDAPVILQVSQNAARYAGLEVLSAVVRTLRDAASVPVILHFDHAESLESAERALSLGFDSVMLETAHLPHDRALEQIRRLVALARERGACVEAEAEVTPKGSRVQEATSSPMRIAGFALASECDWLAVNIGAQHKQVQKVPRLDLERLRWIANETDLPLVLHGASGIPARELAQAVGLGVTKVNVATQLLLQFTGGVRHALSDTSLYDPRAYLGLGRDAMILEARALIRLLAGSARTEN